MSSDLDAIHEYSGRMPKECLSAMSFELLTEELAVRYHVPSYVRYLQACGPVARVRDAPPGPAGAAAPVRRRAVGAEVAGPPRGPAHDPLRLPRCADRGDPPRPAHRVAVGVEPGGHAAPGPQRRRRHGRHRPVPRRSLRRVPRCVGRRPTSRACSTPLVRTTGATPTSSPTPWARCEPPTTESVSTWSRPPRRRWPPTWPSDRRGPRASIATPSTTSVSIARAERARFARYRTHFAVPEEG